MKEVNHPIPATLAAAISRKTNFPNAARTLQYVPRIGVLRQKGNNFFPLLIIQSRLASRRKEGVEMTVMGAVGME